MHSAAVPDSGSLACVLGSLLCHWGRVPALDNPREDGCVLAHSHRGFSAWVLGLVLIHGESINSQVWRMCGRKQLTLRKPRSRQTVPAGSSHALYPV